MAGTKYDLHKLDHTITLTVTISSEYRFRKWIAVQLVRLAVNILGARFEWVDADKPEPLPPTVTKINSTTWTR